MLITRLRAWEQARWKEKFPWVWLQMRWALLRVLPGRERERAERRGTGASEWPGDNSSPGVPSFPHRHLGILAV